MVWKNQLAKTPYLVFFIVLISIGVGTASALITITLAGNVIITDDLTVDTDTLFVDSTQNRVGIGTPTPQKELDVDGDVIVQDDLYVGTTFGVGDDVIWMDDGTQNFSWNDGNDRFQVTDDFAVDGAFQTGFFVPVPYNRFGFHLTDKGLDDNKDLFIHDDLEVDGDLFADGDIQCDECISSSDIDPEAVINSITRSQVFHAEVLSGEDSTTTNMVSTTNSMCFLTEVKFEDLGLAASVDTGTCLIFDSGGIWTLFAKQDFGDHTVCQAVCLTWN